MAVTVERDASGAAVVTWGPHDDPAGYLRQAVDSGRLADALTVLGAGVTVDDLASWHEEDPQAESAVRQTALLTATLTRRLRHLAVILRRRGATWAELAGLLLDDPSARSTARSMHAAGLRQMGLTPDTTTDTEEN